MLMIYTRGFVDESLYIQVEKNYYVLKTEWAEFSLKEKHNELCSCVAMRRQGIVFTGQSACALLGAEKIGYYEVRPHAIALTHKRTDLVRWHVGAEEKNTTIINGMCVVNPIRAIYDLAGSESPETILSIMNSFLHKGILSKYKLQSGIRKYVGMRYCRWLERLASFATGKCESPLETYGWIELYKMKFEMPVQQLEIRGKNKFHVFADMCWNLPDRKIILELDGRSKYVDKQVLWDEKVREDTLRAMGYEFSRIYWAHLKSGEFEQKLIENGIPRRRNFGLTFPGHKK
jgi:hypothetical protein